MISKEDFMWVWKDSSRESILNQFYYEHIVLRKEYEKQNELKKWLEEQIKILEKENPMGHDETSIAYESAYDIVLDKMQELEGE